MMTWIGTLCLLLMSSGQDNLLANGGFEGELEGWRLIDNSGRSELAVDRRTKRKGRQALHLTKTGGAPFDVVRGDLETLPSSGRLEVSMFVKGRDVERAFLKFFLWDAQDESLDANVDLRLLNGSFNWIEVKHTYEIPAGTVSATVMLVMAGGGEVWLDEVRVMGSEAPVSQAPKNLLSNGDFEDGSQTGWQLLDNSGRASAKIATKPAASGRYALHLTKQGGPPFDVLRADVSGLRGGESVRVSGRFRGAELGRAFFKFFAYDESDQPLINDVDIGQLQGTFDWKELEKTYRLPEGARQGAVMIVQVMGGDLWLDDVRVERMGAAAPPVAELWGTRFRRRLSLLPGQVRAVVRDSTQTSGTTGSGSMGGEWRIQQRMTLRAPVLMVFDWVESPACWPSWDRSIVKVTAPFELASAAEDWTSPIRATGARGGWEGTFRKWRRGHEVELEILKGRYLGLRSVRLERRYEAVPMGCVLELTIEVDETSSGWVPWGEAWRRRRLRAHIERCLTRIRHALECVPAD